MPKNRYKKESGIIKELDLSFTASEIYETDEALQVKNEDGSYRYKVVNDTHVERTADDRIDTFKTLKHEEILNAFNSEITDGYFSSTILGIDVDCRRSIAKNDLQNVQGLISYMTRNSITDVTYKGYQDQEKIGVTTSNLETLCEEMEDHVFSLYNKKWTKQAEINSATTAEEVNNISW